VTLPPRKRLDIALGPRYEVGESSSATATRPAGGFRTDYDFVAAVDREIMRDPEREVGYGITDSWDEIVETLQGASDSTDTELGGYVREFETRVRQDMDEIYTRLDDKQTERQLLAGQLNMLFRDRRAYTSTRLLMEAEARIPFEKLSDIGSPRADDHEHLMLPEMLEDPYVESPEYVLESDFEAHPEDDDDEDPKEDPVDYPANGVDNGDDEEESSEDKEDDEMDVEADEEEEEEEYPAPADSIVTEPFETDESSATPPPHPAYRTTARISIPAPIPMPAWSDSEVARLLATSSPPASPLSPWSSPPPQIPFPPLPPILSPHSPILSPAPPPSPIRSLGYRAAMIRLLDEAASTSHSPPSQLPSASRREDRPKVTLPPRKRLDIALGPRYEVGESSSAAAARPAGGFREDYGFVATVDREIMRDLEREVGYGITDSWDEIVETLQGAPVSTWVG
nr:hypothetical protein [Tanacetum cinerariifolium]